MSTHKEDLPATANYMDASSDHVDGNCCDFRGPRSRFACSSAAELAIRWTSALSTSEAAVISLMVVIHLTSNARLPHRLVLLTDLIFLLIWINYVLIDFCWNWTSQCKLRCCD